MTRREAERYMRTEKSNATSIDDLVDLSHAAWDANLVPNAEGIKTADLEDELGIQLNHTIETCLDHLEEIEMFGSTVPSGPDWYVISVRLDEIINGHVDEVAETDIEALIKHMQDDDPASTTATTAATDGARATIRSVLSSTFDVTPATVEQHLRAGDPVDRLNIAVEEITEHPELTKRPSYDEIIFRRGALRWRLTPRAIGLYQQ